MPQNPRPRGHNAAFEQDPAEELALLVEDVAAKLRDGHEKGAIRDSNGNPVGHWSFGAQ